MSLRDKSENSTLFTTTRRNGMTTTALRHISVESREEVTIVKLIDGHIINAGHIRELGEELFGFVDEHRSLIVDFGNVQFLSGAALNRFIILDRKIKNKMGKLRICNIIPELYEVFLITRLNQLFYIRSTLEEALKDF